MKKLSSTPMQLRLVLLIGGRRCDKDFLCDQLGEKWAKKDHLAEIEERASQTPFEETWFADWWLSFLLLGLPSGRGVRTSTLCI